MNDLEKVYRALIGAQFCAQRLKDREFDTNFNISDVGPYAEIGEEYLALLAKVQDQVEQRSKG